MRKKIEKRGGMQKIYHKFIECILRYPGAKITIVLPDQINITWRYGSSNNYITIVRYFRKVGVLWLYSDEEGSWEFMKDKDQELVALTIMKEIEMATGQVIETTEKDYIPFEDKIKRQSTPQTPESLMDSFERNSVEGLALELQTLYDRMGEKRIISSNGNELIIHETDPEIIRGFKQINYILNNRNEFSNWEILRAKYQYNNTLDNEREMIRTQEAKDREVYVKAGVKKITHYFEGQFGYSIDYPC